MSSFDPHSARTSRLPVAPPAPTAAAPPPGPAAPATPQISQCPDCRAPVAADHAYCLSCGARQTVARMPPAAGGAVHGHTGPPPSQHPGSPETPMRDWTPAIALGVLCALALVFAVGVLIGDN